MEKRKPEDIRYAMQKLEERFDAGEFSEKVFSLRFQSLKEELAECQTELMRKTSPRARMIKLSDGITCRQYLEMEPAGHYRVLKELGRGGMGIVYQAEDIFFQGQRLVAIKVLPQNLSQIPETLEDFKREFLTACQLSHQNICAMYEFGQDNDSETYFLVIEYLAGETLGEILSRCKKLSFVQTTPILEQISCGLDFAHSKGILHLDMKPGNIMVCKDGNVKIMDFGLAQKLQPDKTHINLPKTFGTPLYLAPEQVLSGERNVVRASTDLWAMGVMVYEMLAGEPPFKGSTVLQLTHNIISSTPKLITTIPKNAWLAINKALAKDPQKRFTSCKEFVDAMKKPDAIIVGSGHNANGLNTIVIKPGKLPQNHTISQIFHHMFWIFAVISALMFGIFFQQIIIEKNQSPDTAILKPHQNTNDPITSNSSEMIDLPPELQQSCWLVEEEIWDFNQIAWKNLSIEEKTRYAQAYQQWFARKINETVEKKINIQGIIIELCLIPPGRFTMGSPSTEKGRSEDENIQIATIPKPFWLSKYEITQGQWQSIMKNNPSCFKEAGNLAPVENISWDMAKDFCQKTNFVLPTETQWEYACRSGHFSMGYTGDFEILGINNAPKLGKIAWYAGNSGVTYSNACDSRSWPQKENSTNYSGTHPVGEKTPNAWKCYDMLGNVLEWCVIPSEKGSDHEEKHVYRGGSWTHSAFACRIAKRSIWGQVKLDCVGLRVVKSFP